MELTTQGLIEQTQELLYSARKNFVQIAANLYQLKESFAGQNFGQWAEENFDLSQSSISKYLTVYRIYCVEGGATVENLAPYDTESLYLARGLGETAEEKLAQVKTLRRSDLRRNQQDTDGHAFEPKEICKKCGAIRENHS